MTDNTQRLPMTAQEIRTSYRQAADPRKQIKVLAELNACRPAEIRDILTAAGETIEPGRTVRRWSKEEDELLADLLSQGADIGLIASQLGRTEKSVKARMLIVEPPGNFTQDSASEGVQPRVLDEIVYFEEPAPAEEEPVEKKPVSWSKTEEDMLISLVEGGYKRREISEMLERSINSVKHKTMELKKRGRLGSDETELGREEVLELLYYAIGEELPAGREARLVDMLSALGYAVLRYFTEGKLERKST